jgi:ferri-bacillibactin esterase
MQDSPALLYGSIQFDMASQITGRTYRIFVFKPDTPPPTAGYPVVVATDGNMVFPIMATVGATFALAGQAALVVCVGYATDEIAKLFTVRYRDLTPPTPLSGLPQRPGQPPPRLEDYGGSEEFYHFLIEELRPLIAATYQGNPNDQTLYGHSIAGMFTLDVLLNHPGSFRNFVASSPALWWNKRWLLNNMPRIARKSQAVRKTKDRGPTPRVLITVGSTEQDVPNPLPSQILDAIRSRLPMLPSAISILIAKIVVKRMMLGWRMIDNARNFAKRLQTTRGTSRYFVHFHAFEGDDHLTALPSSIGRALAFALRPSPK